MYGLPSAVTMKSKPTHTKKPPPVFFGCIEPFTLLPLQLPPPLPLLLVLPLPPSPPPLPFEVDQEPEPQEPEAAAPVVLVMRGTVTWSYTDVVAWQQEGAGGVWVAGCACSALWVACSLALSASCAAAPAGDVAGGGGGASVVTPIRPEGFANSLFTRNVERVVGAMSEYSFCCILFMSPEVAVLARWDDNTYTRSRRMIAHTRSSKFDGPFGSCAGTTAACTTTALSGGARELRGFPRPCSSEGWWFWGGCGREASTS
eukprot:CAMPEP_0171857896 /NCGR_PEP_ID=MMETSP0992-20121227/24976_1 /TAXON_ID=483369 /ORGANISM="non described non described, Strain CCMP2098" /LENGTH=258 /DNA_ID=CAMNT_0012479247 /DNA_START=202 /DNA_END=975 /DNA_ORIENTATION=+